MEELTKKTKRKNLQLLVIWDLLAEEISCAAELSMKFFFITSGPDLGLHSLHLSVQLQKVNMVLTVISAAESTSLTCSLIHLFSGVEICNLDQSIIEGYCGLFLCVLLFKGSGSQWFLLTIKPFKLTNLLDILKEPYIYPLNQDISTPTLTVLKDTYSIA